MKLLFQNINQLASSIDNNGNLSEAFFLFHLHLSFTIQEQQIYELLYSLFFGTLLFINISSLFGFIGDIVK